MQIAWSAEIEQSGILIICTANRCRSPMGEALLRHTLGGRAAQWSVSSAGLMPSGSSVVPEVEDVMMNDYGLDVSAHRSRRITTQLVDSVELVLCMERRHVREVVVQDRAAFSRAFTVKEFLRRAAVTPRERSQSLEAWVRLLSAGRNTQMLMGRSPEDDIDDPIGQPIEVFRKCAQEIAAAMATIAEILAT